MVGGMSRRQAIAVGAAALAVGARGRAGATPTGGDMKTIGVLGGLGPQATMDFEARVHRAAQRLIPPDKNRGYPPMVVYYFRHSPALLTAEGQPMVPHRPDPRLFEAARRLGSLADFLVIASNGVHLLHAEIERAAGRKVLNMIEATLAEVRRRGWRRVGVLTLSRPVVYTRPLARDRIAYETLDADVQAALDAAIFRVMEGRDDAGSAAARRAVSALRTRGVDGLILGCTELPLLLREDTEAEDLINPGQLLAEAAVKLALS
jgi:aspartate racemase